MAVKGLYTDEAALLDRAPATLDEGNLVRSSDRRARLFVWGSWTAGLVSSFILVLSNARNFPMYEDWQMVRSLTGYGLTSGSG